MGHVDVIKIDPVREVKYGGADPRGDGAALGCQLFNGIGESLLLNYIILAILFQVER